MAFEFKMNKQDKGHRNGVVDCRIDVVLGLIPEVDAIRGVRSCLSADVALEKRAKQIIKLKTIVAAQ